MQSLGILSRQTGGWGKEIRRYPKHFPALPSAFGRMFKGQPGMIVIGVRMLLVVNSLLPHLYSQFSYGADLCHECHGSNNDVKAEASRLCLISFHIHCTADNQNLKLRAASRAFQSVSKDLRLPCQDLVWC